ncbi:MAG: aminomethyl-transferring glycine dehydrogenase subunit GcvPA [Syntrophales bacterium]|jgi:glycine dehydrogenase subunit 1
MAYVPNPPEIIQDMIRSIGMRSTEELFADIPDAVRIKEKLHLGAGMSEVTLRREMASLASQNVTTDQMPCFLGGGAYDHYIPTVVEQVLSRSEFYTAYTPYQPEISQGILQAIFEYQTMICSITGMDVSNASLYDGGSALAEACHVACDATGRRRVILPDVIHPHYLGVLKTYAIGGRMEVVQAASVGGETDPDAMIALFGEEPAAVVIQHPNYFGNLEGHIETIAKAIHARKGLLIMIVDPISLGILKPPGEWGADMAVGEGQALGNPLSFGGPYLGFLTATTALMRKIPGRLVGLTRDLEGRRAFVLTLQAREQHIRRARAGSNICSNEALCALAAAVYLTVVGPQGLKEIAKRCHDLAAYARQRLEQEGIRPLHDKPFFKEFAISLSTPHDVDRKLLDQGILGGLPLDEGGILLAFTEKRTRAEIDRLVNVLGGHNREEVDL